MPELSDYQKKTKAKNIVERMELNGTINDLRVKINNLFNDAPIMILESNSKEEMEELTSAIKNGTATNIKISRFLEIASSLGI